LNSCESRSPSLRGHSHVALLEQVTVFLKRAFLGLSESKKQIFQMDPCRRFTPREG
jgi:hypothetical protein